jgi:hypothetical protein
MQFIHVEKQLTLQIFSTVSAVSVGMSFLLSFLIPLWHTVEHCQQLDYMASDDKMIDDFFIF